MSEAAQHSRKKHPIIGELLAVGSLIIIALSLALPNLGTASLWHDELVHVFVAKSIAATGAPVLPSGDFYPSSTAYNLLLAGVVRFFGDSATAVRALSALLSALNVLLLYFLCRKWQGRACAVLAAGLLALSPWHVSWAREARLYEMQITTYLLLLLCTWNAFEASQKKSAAAWTIGAIAAYIAGVFTSYHSILFLSAIGGYALLHFVQETVFSMQDNRSFWNVQTLKTRWTLALFLCLVLGLLTVIGFLYNPNAVDRSAVFETGLGGRMPDPQRQDRWLYLRFLWNNLSLGIFATALLGTMAAWRRNLSQTRYAAVAFWAPVLVLTFLIGYRRPRFMYFTFPFYQALVAYGLVYLASYIRRPKTALHSLGIALIILVFATVLRSQILLTQDSIQIARGAHTTLARRHPQWQKPCAYVREHMNEHAILTTTYLPVLYYVGRVDNWFPNRYRKWEVQESGLVGLETLEELQDFVAQHPSGFFLAEYDRFEKWSILEELPELQNELEWVQQHMHRIESASSTDVTVYAWGNAVPEPS